MGTGVYISANLQYINPYDSNDVYGNTQITFTLIRGLFPSSHPYISYRLRNQNSAVWSDRIGGGNGAVTLTVPLSNLISESEYKNGDRYCKVKACCMTAEQGSIGGWTDNEITLYITDPLAAPKIISITPKSPKITETLKIQCSTVANADYYALEAMWQIPGSGRWYTSKIRDNIPAADLELNPFVETIPGNTLAGITQNGMIYYRLCAYSNNKRYTESCSAYTPVNLDLASNVRFKIGGNWVRGKPYIRTGGQWHRAVKTYIKSNGVWKNR